MSGYMMNFRTQVERPEKVTEIRYSDRMLLLGSCFAENIGKLLLANKFCCDVNPYGILYNPLSIAKALEEMLEGKTYSEKDLFEADGMWHSWMHHSNFSSDSSAEECLHRINGRLIKASESLASTEWLIVTWGTAFVYEHEGQVVGNCHKQPDRLFVRRRLSVDEIVEKWAGILSNYKKLNPSLKVLFTVSPIRHAKDGMHGNQLSKSTLLLAIDQFCEMFSYCHYFPSYEILMDELRDYRFYADDMLHPSSMAVEYIWECFCQTYFSKDTLQTMKEWNEIQKALQHKPFRPQSEGYRQFLSQIMLRIERMKQKFPYIDAQNELELCHTLLKI